MAIYTHYTVHVLDGGGLARGMYSSASAYETPELARELGPLDPHLSQGKRLALTRVETRDDVGNNGNCRALVRETILEVLPVAGTERV